MLFKQGRQITIIIQLLVWQEEDKGVGGGCEYNAHTAVRSCGFLSRWLRPSDKMLHYEPRPGSQGDSWLGARSGRKGDSCNPGKLQGKCHYVPTAPHRQRWTEHNLTTNPITYNCVALSWMKRNDCKNINHEKPLRWRGSEGSTETWVRVWQPQSWKMLRSPTLH